ncbi:MAG: DUF2834 domain-containing protein [Gammaproteobacteria bacterium]|nr:DUF2834 domain-containing protein [Gammaproteobacteria bacterium]
MGSTRLSSLYLVLAGAGLIATWYFNLRFIEESGGVFNIAEFVRAGNANSAASSLANDLLVATLTFLVWSFVEARRLAIRHWWVFLVLTFTVAFALAFPLFLYVRERTLRNVQLA